MKTRRILVAGAGPVGLVAAAPLAEEGMPVTIIEAEQELPDDLRTSIRRRSTCWNASACRHRCW